MSCVRGRARFAEAIFFSPPFWGCSGISPELSSLLKERRLVSWSGAGYFSFCNRLGPDLTILATLLYYSRAGAHRTCFTTLYNYTTLYLCCQA
jgi:hypothetical protein